MNKYKTIATEYLRPSRTLETVLIQNKGLTEVFFVYNKDGVSFRLFKSHLELINFFENKSESDFHFHTEVELDGFLAKVKLVS